MQRTIQLADTSASEDPLNASSSLAFSVQPVATPMSRSEVINFVDRIVELFSEGDFDSIYEILTKKCQGNVEVYTTLMPVDMDSTSTPNTNDDNNETAG